MNGFFVEFVVVVLVDTPAAAVDEVGALVTFCAVAADEDDVVLVTGEAA